MVLRPVVVLLLTAGCVAAEPVAVTLHDSAQVAGERLELGEIAALAGPAEQAEQLAALDLGPAPLPGQSRTLSLGYVKMRLRRWGLGEDDLAFSGATEVEVSTAPVAVAAPATPTMQEASTEPLPAPVVVKRGSAVRLLVTCGAVTVVAGATTLEDAAVGAIVKLRVDQTRRTAWATLDSPTHASLTR